MASNVKREKKKAVAFLYEWISMLYVAKKKKKKIVDVAFTVYECAGISFSVGFASLQALFFFLNRCDVFLASNMLLCFLSQLILSRFACSLFFFSPFFFCTLISYLRETR